MSKNDFNLEILKIAAKLLQPLKDEIVFLGGSTVSLFITEPNVVTIRETFDVDCVVEVSHRNSYEDTAKKLRLLGFNEDTESKVICRFKKDSLILDVMPTDPKVLGFTNIWYKDGFKKSKMFKIGNEEIQVFDLPYLVATKIEAFKGRGKGEYLVSHDIEDLVTLLDGRRTIADDLAGSDAGVVGYLKTEFKKMSENNKFLASLDGHISDRENVEGRKKIILERIGKFLEQ